MGALSTKGACCDGTDVMRHGGVSVCVEPMPMGSSVVGFEERDEISHIAHLAHPPCRVFPDQEVCAGWTGFRPFRVASRRAETADITEYTLTPVDSNGEKFDFRPGQALRMKVDVDGVGTLLKRDYTVISRPGETYLQIAVKRLPFGKVSSFLHEHALEGAELLVAKPTGTFIVPQSSRDTTAVLLSAGIGITPMVALLQALGKRVALAAHVDKSEDTHAYRQRFTDAGVTMQVQYTKSVGRPPRDIGARLVRTAGVDHDWFICGPRGFMNDAVDTLSDAGVDMGRVHVESFRPMPAPTAAPVQLVQPQQQFGCWIPRRPPSSRLKGA